jgi:hypothetical protein
MRPLHGTMVAVPAHVQDAAPDATTSSGGSRIIPTFQEAITALREATLRGMVMPGDERLLAHLHAQIAGVPGVAPPPGPHASSREALDWLMKSFTAFRAEQERRRHLAGHPRR